MKRRQFVILDRDGTIIVERHYLSDPLQIEILPGAVRDLRQLLAMGLGLVVVTNQFAVGAVPATTKESPSTTGLSSESTQLNVGMIMLSTS